MSQAENVELLQTLTRLAGEGEKARPLLNSNINYTSLA